MHATPARAPSPARDASSPSRARPAAVRRVARLARCAAASLLLLAAAPHAVLAADVRVAVNDRVAHALLAFGSARDEFEREGVTVELVRAADPVAAVADGEAELAATTADALLGAERYALELRAALLLGFALDGEALVTGPGVTSLAALRGRVVAFEPGSTGELLLDYALQRTGLSLDDVRTVALDPDPAAVAAALADGTLDAAVLRDPELRTLEALGVGGGVGGGVGDGGRAPFRRLASAADRPGLVADVLAGEERWLARNKEPVKSVIRAWNRTVGRVRRDPAGAAAAIGEVVGLDPALAARALTGFRPLDVADNVELTRGEYQSAFSDMSETLERRDRVNARGVPSANRYLSLAALRQVAAGR